MIRSTVFDINSYDPFCFCCSLCHVLHRRRSFVGYGLHGITKHHLADNITFVVVTRYSFILRLFSRKLFSSSPLQSTRRGLIRCIDYLATLLFRSYVSGCVVFVACVVSFDDEIDLVVASRFLGISLAMMMPVVSCETVS